MRNKKVIFGLIAALILGFGAYSKFNTCGLLFKKEDKEVCYIKKAIKKEDSNYCSNIETVYREKRCVDLVESTKSNPEQMESVLRSLDNI